MGMKEERLEPSDDGTALGRGLLFVPSCRAGVLRSFLNWSLFIFVLLRWSCQRSAFVKK